MNVMMEPVGFPTKAEAVRARAPEEVYAAGARTLGRDLAWLLRHSEASVEEALDDARMVAEALLDQWTVWAVTILPCECGQNGSVGVLEWRVSEALRDRAADDLLMDGAVSTGDVMAWWVVVLPDRLGALSDEEVTDWCDLVTNGGEVEPRGSKRYGECPACGRSETTIGGDVALERLMEVAMTADGVDTLEERVQAVLRAAGLTFAGEGGSVPGA